MTQLTIPSGNTYSDDGTTGRDMRDGGFRTWMFPLISEFLAYLASYFSILGAALTATSSTSSVAIGAGSFTLTVASPSTKSFVAGMWVTALDAANSANWVNGVVTSYNSTTGALAFTVGASDFSGSGSPANWTITVSGRRGATGSTGAAGVNGSGPVWYGTSTGSANAQVLAGSLAALTGNPSVEFIAGYSNTGALTLAVGSTAATAVRTAAGVALTGGEVLAGTKYVVTYDGTYWRLAAGGGSTGMSAIVAALVF